MAGAVLVTAVYRDTTRLGNAYGVCVMFVTFFDTCMVTLVALIVWRLSPLVVFLPWLFFAAIDGLYLSSALIKVPDGAWLTLLVSGILAALFLLWRFGKEKQWRAEAEDRFKLGTLVTTAPPGSNGTGEKQYGLKEPEPNVPAGSGDSCPLRLTDKWGGDTLSSIRGLGVFFDKSGTMTPTVFTQFVTKFVAVPEVTVFFHLHPVEIPTVPDSERYLVARFREIPGCYRLIVTHGFMDVVITPDPAALVYEQVRAFITRSSDGAKGCSSSTAAAFSTGSEVQDGLTRSTGRATDQSSNGPEGNPDSIEELTQRKPTTDMRSPKIGAELASLDRAFAAKVMYVVGKEQMRVRAETGWGRRAVLSTFLWIRDNTRAKIASLRLAMDRVAEVGFVKDI